MSSHREAPEISKDPVADSTDVYAFVSPDAPDTVTLIANYVPLQAPDGGPNFYEFGDDVLYHINIDNNGDGERGDHLRAPLQHGRAEPEHVPLQHRPHPVAGRQPLEPAADLLAQPAGQERQPAAHHGPGHEPALPALQHRPPVDAQLHRPGQPGRPHPRRRREGVRRPTGRGLLRRPRRHLRPGRPAAPRAAPQPVRVERPRAQPSRLRGSTRARASTSTPSPCRCRRPSSPPTGRAPPTPATPAR